jgi:hypothetical protein
VLRRTAAAVDVTCEWYITGTSQYTRSWQRSRYLRRTIGYMAGLAPLGCRSRFGRQREARREAREMSGVYSPGLDRGLGTGAMGTVDGAGIERYVPYSISHVSCTAYYHLQLLRPEHVLDLWTGETDGAAPCRMRHGSRRPVPLTLHLICQPSICDGAGQEGLRNSSSSGPAGERTCEVRGAKWRRRRRRRRPRQRQQRRPSRGTMDSVAGRELKI